ncbi:UDP-N-acetylmuramoyl-L-alanyl-D-glutamate--2,6-diaminopimelate ligase [Marivibrio halodurans]|uniref:UDP-N-acetylmuramoyl-L-alanyl-D-glutamate--2,6-diaminopimelate ligase n=2 Tax=Marivibrio halodurans TaxID=2039722 RepID=A0A8J7V398_9PROT|nr:UDP-N-acetylmuramoyl-L-alanyl-D-glutamate--2,6-diaminopimelate ligase [Marivibrio halodurans]
MNGDGALPHLPLTGLTADSRRVRPGYLFAAIPGTKVDGARFARDAVAAGAIAVLAPPGALDGLDLGPEVTIVTDSNPRRRLAKMAARFYSPQPKLCVGVTGTNGKTSVASFTRQLWAALGNPAASIGTLGIQGPGYPGGAGLTTPDPVDLHREMRDLARARIDHVAMEASSHGLDQYRLDGVGFAAAAFTNLSRDHLDYHASMEAYRAAKFRLFEELLPRGGAAVVNARAREFEALSNIAHERGLELHSYGLEHGRIRCLSIEPRGGGFDLALDVMGDRFRVDFPLPGRFQIENALAALGLVLATGSAVRVAVPLLARLEGVRGRLEPAGRRTNSARVYVDYAHTPDALETVLKTLRPHVAGRLHVVFGCGGDRDRGKRPMMGAVAADHADVAIVTDDNPRTEDAAAIRAEILPSCPDAIEIGERAEAIERAIAGLAAGDVLLVAGKGHEQGQTVGTTVHPFDDVEAVRKSLARLDGAPNEGDTR